MSSTTQLPLEIWYQILNQTLNLLLPTATTPRLYSTHILPLLLTSHTFHEHCHPITAPHLRKHKLLQLFTRWKAAHSREVHFYHHPLRTHVRYALPDRVGNPPGEEYETLYSFIKRAYLFGCESVCGTVIPVEGGLEGPPAVPAAAAVAAPGAPGAAGAIPATQNGDVQATIPATGAIPTPASAATGTGATPVPGNLVIAPPPAPVAPPAPTHHGGDGGGQGWKGHALQWHVANPTFAAEGTLELYRDVVEEYRRVVCGSPASRERAREMELIMDRIRNPHRYATVSTEPIADSIKPSQQSSVDQQAEMEIMEQIKDVAEEDEEDMEENDGEDDNIEDDESDMIERDEGEFLSEIEAKGGLRRRDSGHGQSSSDMDIDDDLDEDDEEDEDEDMMGLDQQGQERHRHPYSPSHSEKLEGGSSSGLSRNSSKREPETMTMDYQLEGASRYRRGLRNRKMERSYSANEQERLIMDMALDKPYHAMGSLSPFHPIDLKAQLPPTPSGSSSSSSSSIHSPPSSLPPVSASGYTRSGSPAPFTPLAPSSRKAHDTGYSRSKSSRNALQRSHSSPGTTTVGVRIPNDSSRSHLGTGPLDTHLSSSLENATDISSPPPPTTLASTLSPPSQGQQLPRALRAEDLDFDLASACANTFASDLAFVLARVPGLGAHFHRFEQLAKLKLHVGWAKHAQSRGGNDVFVMSCSRLIGLLAPLANTPLVSERGG
ncbi:hypothetical protein BGX24_012702 [Mortierella sp. AD032]|nr:hypothetical protein BGX24_012702 [Mortierella sp. AD032]